MFKNLVYNIYRDVKNMKTRDEAFASCISNRLENLLDNYKYDTQLICDYLLSRNSLKVLKHIYKEKKKGEL